MNAKGRMNQTYWPGETIMLLEFYWIERLSAKEIGERIGKTKNAVIGFTDRNNFVYRPGLNPAFYERDGIPLSPKGQRNLDRRRRQAVIQQPVERWNGAIRGSTLPPLKSLENALWPETSGAHSRSPIE